MNNPTISSKIQANKQKILDISKKYGASNIRIFGSYARGEETPDSDLDLLVDMEDGTTLFDRIGLMQELEDLLGVKIDIAKPDNLHDLIRDPVIDEAVKL
jgi:hypothetical protein